MCVHICVLVVDTTVAIATTKLCSDCSESIPASKKVLRIDKLFYYFYIK